jgi:glucarate dehydratase
VDGEISVPEGPGLGVTLDRDKLAGYAELYERLGGYPYDRDPERPGWYSTAPNFKYAEVGCTVPALVPRRGPAGLNPNHAPKERDGHRNNAQGFSQG